MQESISALELPPFTRTDESDADDDEEVIAGLIAASQALKQMPNKDESATYDEDLSLEEKENLSEKPFSRSDSDTEESEEEPPPDPYGMPPLSQWRRSSKRG